LAKTVGVFDFEINVYGARVVVRGKSLLTRCRSGVEIDADIQLLKDDLDAVAKRMKSAVRKQAQEPLGLEVTKGDE